MILTITTTHRPATDLGYLLHKNPAGGPQTFELAFGQVHVFYPEASAERCTAAMLLDIDPIKLVRGSGTTIRDYVNDRPYVASSFLSVAIARVLGSALGGRSTDRPELAATPLALEMKLAAVPCRGSEGLASDLFTPLGYEIGTEAAADPDEGRRYRNLTLRATKTLSEMLSHLYVLLPVLDNQKHYFIGKAELEKLLARGKGWLETHPLQQLITERYLGGRRALASEALGRLEPGESDGAADEPEREGAGADPRHPEPADKAEPARPLHEQRHDWVVEALGKAGANRVIDYGCGEGKLLARLVGKPELTAIVGADGSARALEIAGRRLKLRRLSGAALERIQLLHTALTYRDRRLAGYDAAAVVEVVEHIDPDRLDAFEQALFGCARPTTIALTTPNRDYNATFANPRPDGLRHRDHRFEWTRAEFKAWAARIAETYGYEVETGEIGDADTEHGAATQRGLFRRCK